MHCTYLLCRITISRHCRGWVHEAPPTSCPHLTTSQQKAKDIKLTIKLTPPLPLPPSLPSPSSPPQWRSLMVSWVARKPPPPRPPSTHVCTVHYLMTSLTRQCLSVSLGFVSLPPLFLPLPSSPLFLPVPSSLA